MNFSTPGVMTYPDLLDAHSTAHGCIEGALDLAKLPDVIALPRFPGTPDHDPFKHALLGITPHRLRNAVDAIREVNLELIATHPPGSGPVVFHDLIDGTGHACAARLLFGALVALIKPTTPVRFERSENNGPRFHQTPGVSWIEFLTVDGIMKAVSKRSVEENIKILKELRAVITDEATMKLCVTIDRESAASVAARGRNPAPPNYLDELAILEEMLEDAIYYFRKSRDWEKYSRGR